MEEKINTIANELNNKMKQVKQQEEDFMKKIDNNPNDVAQLAQEELNKEQEECYPKALNTLFSGVGLE